MPYFERWGQKPHCNRLETTDYTRGPVTGIALDLDEVVADCCKRLAQTFLIDNNIQVTPQKLAAMAAMYWTSSPETARELGFDVKKWEEHKQCVFLTQKSPDFHAGIVPFFGAQQIVWELNAIAPVTYVTSRADINVDPYLNGSPHRWVDNDGAGHLLELRCVTEEWLTAWGFPLLPLVSLSLNTRVPDPKHPNKHDPAFSLGLNLIVDDKVPTVVDFLTAAAELGKDAYGIVVQHPHNTIVRDGRNIKLETVEQLAQFNSGRTRAVHLPVRGIVRQVAMWQSGC